MPSAIAEAFVTLRPDTSRFAAEAQTNIGQPLKKIATGAVALFAAVKVKDFLGGAVDAARESNKVAAQTEAVIRSTGGAANLTAGDFEKLAGSISRKTGIDDEQIQSASNLLATFTKVRDEVGKGNDIFSQATQIAVDMGAALGTDASGSAIQLGKALNDPIRGVTALTRVGVTFTSQQREQIKALVDSGNTLDAQKIILRELTTEFGGSAAAQATAADRMRVTLGNVQESVGGLLVPTLEKAAAALDSGIRFFEVLPGPVKAGVGAMAAFAGGALIAAKVTDVAKNSLGLLNRGFGEGSVSASKFGKALGAIGVGVSVGFVLKELHDDVNRVKVDFEELASASEKELVRAFQETQKWGESGTKVFREIANASVTDGQRLIDGLKAEGVATGDLQKILDDLIGKKKQADATSRKNADATSAETAATADNNRVLGTSVEIVQKAIEGEERRKKAIEDLTKAMDDRRVAALADADAEVALARADNRAQDAVNAYSAALQEHGEKSVEVRDRILDYRDSLSEAAGAAVRAAEEDRKAHGEAALSVQEKVGIQIAELGKLRDTLAPDSPLRKVVEDYIGRLKAVPTDIVTNLRIQTDSRGVTIVRNDKGEITFKGFAEGGRPPINFASLVGERGPELFVPDRPGTVLSNDALGRILSGQSGGASTPTPLSITQQFYGATSAADAQRRAVLGLRKLQYEGVLT